jgi:Cro/C1-type HTH DNA-binding domain
MEREAVPQDDSRTLGGYRKAVYARDAQGRIVPVASSGWVVEEVVTTQAADALRLQAEAARLAARAGTGSPLSYWMYARRMDLPLLAQTTGLWQWQVRRHLRQPIARLKPSTLARYARALGLPATQLMQCPDAPEAGAAPPQSPHGL